MMSIEEYIHSNIKLIKYSIEYANTFESRKELKEMLAVCNSILHPTLKTISDYLDNFKIEAYDTDTYAEIDKMIQDAIKLISSADKLMKKRKHDEEIYELFGEKDQRTLDIESEGRKWH